MRLTVEATPVGGVRTVRLRSEGEDLARWEVRPRILQTLSSPAFRLPPGMVELTLERDGPADGPALIVASVRLVEAPGGPVEPNSPGIEPSVPAGASR